MKKILSVLLGTLMAITVVVTGYAIATNGSQESISANLVWGYVLMAVALCSVLLCTVYGMAQNTATIKSTLLSVVLVVVVIAISYFVAQGHDTQIVDLANDSFFDRGETVIADASIIVTYIAAVAAIASALFSEVAKLFK